MRRGRRDSVTAEPAGARLFIRRSFVASLLRTPFASRRLRRLGSRRLGHRASQRGLGYSSGGPSSLRSSGRRSPRAGCAGWAHGDSVTAQPAGGRRAPNSERTPHRLGLTLFGNGNGNGNENAEGRDGRAEPATRNPESASDQPRDAPQVARCHEQDDRHQHPLDRRAGTCFCRRAPQYMPAAPPRPNSRPSGQSGATASSG